MVNPEGKCFVFDSRGSGYSRGEGVGTLVLKLLSHAIEDGDPVHSVILNSALNQDGKTAGISLPNPNAQAALMNHVYASAGLDPGDTLYIEAHGTVSSMALESPLFLLQAAWTDRIFRALKLVSYYPEIL
jgi:acyl transferase domain-containing protein